ECVGRMAVVRFFFQAEDGIRDWSVTGVQTCALPIYRGLHSAARTGGTLARAPLGATAAQRYGAPYWVVHRGDLQQALVDAVSQEDPKSVVKGKRGGGGGGGGAVKEQEVEVRRRRKGR